MEIWDQDQGSEIWDQGSGSGIWDLGFGSGIRDLRSGIWDQDLQQCRRQSEKAWSQASGLDSLPPGSGSCCWTCGAWMKKRGLSTEPWGTPWQGGPGGRAGVYTAVTGTWPPGRTLDLDQDQADGEDPPADGQMGIRGGEENTGQGEGHKEEKNRRCSSVWSE